MQTAPGRLYDPAACPCKMVQCPYFRDCEQCVAHHHGADSYRETGCELFLAGLPVYGEEKRDPRQTQGETSTPAD